jgi:hypothetical protein
MNSKKAIAIMDLVTGDELETGLSTIGIALIHLCHFNGVEKCDMLNALAGQWDLYQKQRAKVEAREKVNIN